MLTDLKARQAKPRDRDYKLADSGGLDLFITTRGFRSWRMKYRFAGTEKRLTFGPYPAVSLSEARDKRDEAKRLLREHRDPATEELKRRLAAAADQEATFETVARRWHKLHESRWAPVHAGDVLRSLEREIFPAVGAIPIRQLDAPLVLVALRKIEARGSLETAKRVRQRMSAVFESSHSTEPKACPSSTRQPIVLVKLGHHTGCADVPAAAPLRAPAGPASASGDSPAREIDDRQGEGARE